MGLKGKHQLWCVPVLGARGAERSDALFSDKCHGMERWLVGAARLLSCTLQYVAHHGSLLEGALPVGCHSFPEKQSSTCVQDDRLHGSVRQALLVRTLSYLFQHGYYAKLLILPWNLEPNIRDRTHSFLPGVKLS